MTGSLSFRFATKRLVRTDLLILLAPRDEAPGGDSATIWEKTGLDWQKTARAARFTGARGQTLDLVAPGDAACDRLVVFGVGEWPAADALANWAALGGDLMAFLATSRATKAAIVLDSADETPAIAAHIAAGMKLRHYRFDKYRQAPTDNDNEPETGAPSVTIRVAKTAPVKKAFADRDAVTSGTLLARDLMNEPANVLGPVEFADRLETLREEGLDVEILDQKALEKLGMGALLSVAQGSSRPARLAVMSWRGGKAGKPPVAFVGKGVCFDSGGISIKPAASMEDMKGDMGGAAAVTGLMLALARRQAKTNAIGIVGLVENMPSGNATRPGDIVTAMSGTTIEVINTDAEGRLVLADALHYAIDRFKPAAIVDVATLTGAVVIALGHEYAGLFANDDRVAMGLAKAGAETGEKVWRLPLDAEYAKLIKSRFADIKNTGGRWGGAITAAQFLARFVGKTPWAHLDIAGTGFGAPRTRTNAGWAAGFGVALLDRFVRDNHER